MRPRNALVITPAPLRSGGLGLAAAEFFDGLCGRGIPTVHVGARRPSPLRPVTESRPFRRAFGTALARRLAARAVRSAVPSSGWDLAYATPGAVPVEAPAGVTIVHQATHYPALEWELLRRAERATGGRGDLSRAERRRRERELRLADLVHVTSAAVRDEFLEAGFPAERLVLAPLGVDLRRYALGEKDAGLRIAFIGPLSMRKGVDVVAELAARLKGNAVIETVGGPTCPWSRRISREAEFVPGDSVPGVLGKANVLVLPSRCDGFSYVVLEALASGTVPIVTPAVGAAEIVRELDPRLVVGLDGFAEAAIDLLPRLDLKRLSPRARAIAERFDRRRTSEQMVSAILRRIEAGKGTPPSAVDGSSHG